jgi:hypothetical protein
MSRNDGEFPVFSILYNIFAIPTNLLIGFVVGVVAPVAAIAAMVAGVRLLTGDDPSSVIASPNRYRLGELWQTRFVAMLRKKGSRQPNRIPTPRNATYIVV